MASGKSNYLIRKQLNQGFNGAAWVPPTSGWIALTTTAPTAANGGTELAFANGYARKEIDFDTTNFPTTTLNEISNALEIELFTPSADLGEVVGWKLMDASTGGNLLWFGLIEPAKEIFDGEPQTIPAGMLKFYEDNEA